MLEQHDLPVAWDNAVLVVGGGVAGMQAALDLAGLGIESILVEKNAFLGGKCMQMDTICPTDHCACCQIWPIAKECLEHPDVHVILNAEVTNLAADGLKVSAEITSCPPLVDRNGCLYCGACFDACRRGALQRGSLNVRWNPAIPLSVCIDPILCSRCGDCVKRCPVQAIRLDVAEQSFQVTVADVICATGFSESLADQTSCAPEYGIGIHPDIFSAMEFENWHASSPLRTRSDGRLARSVAFIQCAGSRDIRHLPYCSAVCCMHAVKQARWLKRRHHDLDITIFYTDLRNGNAGQEAYVRACQDAGISFVRSHPGLVLPLPQAEHGIMVRYEQPKTGIPQCGMYDIVVISGGLRQCPLPGAPQKEATGKKVLSCGFCNEPSDIPGSVIQGSSVAMQVACRLRREGGSL